MKAGWEIKKLGEVCKLYQPKTISVEMFVEDGEYFVYGANGIIGHYNQYNHEDSEVLLTCRGATCGSVNISEPYSWINGNAMVVKPLDKNNIKQQFLKYYLISVDWNDIITGAAQPQITRLSLSPLPIPIPPLPEQERIVSELDLISGVIDKKKQQLKELDSLAQSLFYEMFGNPVENEKGWDVKKLEEVCPYITDGSHYSPKAEDDGIIPMLSVKDMEQNCFSYNTCKMICYEEYLKLVLAGCKPNKGDVLIAKDGSFFKYIFEVKEDKEQAILSSIAIVRPNVEIVNASYLVGCLSTKDIYQYVERELITGTAIKRVILKGLRKMKVTIPPLPLQQEFASKIESIERQKELIKQSLAETETLFNSRMDFYFN